MLNFVYDIDYYWRHNLKVVGLSRGIGLCSNRTLRRPPPVLTTKNYSIHLLFGKTKWIQEWDEDPEIGPNGDLFCIRITHIYIIHICINIIHFVCTNSSPSFVEDRGVSRYHNFWYLEANVWIAKNRLKTHFDGLSKDQVGHCNKSPLLWKAFSCIRAIHKTLLFIFSLSILSFLNAWLTH